MSIRSSIRSLTILVMSLATTGVAFARNPPALVRSQEPQGQLALGSGYRDSLTRVGERERSVETARAAAGYRDALTRFARSTPVRIAANR